MTLAPAGAQADALPQGLTSLEAAERLERDGPNLVPGAPPASLLTRIGLQLRDPMILLLLGALVVVVIVGDAADAVIIAAVVVVNTTIGVVQELRAESAIAALSRMAAPRAHVLRDGSVRDVVAAEVVVGDLVRLEAGDVIPADLRLVEAVAVMVDEAAMTGESVPVARDPGDEVLGGTVVTTGRATGLVARTGADSGLGRIAALIAGSRPKATPLQVRLGRLSRQLVAVTGLLCAVVFALALARGDALVPSLVLAVSLGVAAVPESLPAVVTVSLAMGAHRMAQHAAVVRWLPAVETLGSVTVLATDKTGTLTEGRMVVERLWTPDGACEVSGHGYLADGSVTGTAVGDASDRLLRDVSLCNDAVLTGLTDGQWTFVGDPMEAALLIAASRGGVDLVAVQQWTRVGEEPFDSEIRRMTTRHRDVAGHELVITKGAPEVVLARVVDTPDVERARTASRELADAGYRVLAVAEGDDLVGLVAIADPPRENAAEVVAACRDAGIRTVLITGDHPATARAIAERVGIERPGHLVADGEMVARGEHVALVDSLDVYARTRPEQKVAIVDAWQARGHVVAMTGDGVNDAPALRRADIGVAMGGRGTEVARQAADIVLADDDLATLVTAVAEGRRIYANIRSFLRYALAGGFAEVVTILVAPFVGLMTPLTPAMILWINLLTHGVPGVAFGGEPLDPELMRHPSPSPRRQVLDGRLTRQVLVAGSLIALVSVTAGLVADRMDGSVQTCVFLALGFGQLSVALALRAPRSGAALRERGLEVAVLIAAMLQLAGVWFAPLRSLLGTDAVPLAVVGAVVAAGCVPGLVVRVTRRWERSGPPVVGLSAP